MSKFRLTITREDGATVHLRPGTPDEHDFVAAIAAAARGVFRTEASIAAAVAAAFTAAKRAVEPST